MRRSVASLLFVHLCFALVTPRHSCAQNTYGAIHGTVQEGSGEPVPGATVTVTSVEKGAQLKLKTNQHGRFEFPRLLPESYDLTAEASGRKTTTQDISVVADGDALVNPVLPRRGQSAVTGTTGGSTLKTRADVSITFDRTAIQSLPNFNQNASALPLLAPSAQLRSLPINFSQSPEQNVLVSLNGNLPSGTALLLDGTDNRIPTSQISVINPALESLAEIRIITQSYDAGTGQALSGVVAAETRSGSNVWHGSLLDFRRTNWAAASNPNLQNPSLAGISPFRIDLFGAAVGGPIVKNKLFVFGDYQGTRRAFTSTQLLNVPTQRVRDTCLNLTTECDLSEYQSPIYDPQTSMLTNCTGVPSGSCIPQSSISPQAANLLSLLPPPNLPGVVSNYQIAGGEGYDDDSFTARVDNNLTHKLQLMGRYSYADYRVNGASGFGSTVGGAGFGPDGFAGQSRSRDHSLSTGFDYSLRPSLLTDFRFGFYRSNLQVLQNDYGTTPATNAGIPGLNLGDNLTSGMPAILIHQPNFQTLSSNINFGDGEPVNGCDCPLTQQLQQFQWVSNWAQTQGNHVFRWGADFRYEQDLTVNSSPHRPGLLTFSGAVTSGLTDPGGLGLATFLLGYVTSFSRTVGSISDAEVHQKRTFFYAQDTWRATPRLTLSYGLRWEIYFPQSVNGKNKGGYLDLNTGTLDVAGYPCCNFQGNVHNALTNLAPRLGMALQLDSRTILRAAYGRNFDAASPQVYGNGATSNPPVALAQGILTGAITTLNKQRYVFELGSQVCASSPGICVVPPAPAILYPNVPANGQIPPSSLVGVAANAVPSTLRVPTLDQWNLTLQREIASNMYFEIGYVGNKGTHLPLTTSGSYNLNQPTIAGYLANNCYIAATDATSPACLDRYPFYNNAPNSQLCNFCWTQPINYTGDDGSSNYNSLQSRLVKRFSKGYEFQANYTWAKGLGYDGTYYNQNPRLNYGVNLFDRRHTFVFYNVFKLPVGKGKALLGNASTAVNYLVGGWSVNTTTSWASGLPFSLTYNSIECAFDRDTGPCRPNIVGYVHVTGDRNSYFTTTGGVQLTRPKGVLGPIGPIGPWQRPAVGTFGTAGYNSMRGPTYYDTDAAITKDIAISERYLIQFRTDFLNVFNRVNLGNPSPCVDCISATTGLATGGIIANLAPNASQRQVEFSLRVQF
jgi:hypothetical protein